MVSSVLAFTLASALAHAPAPPQADPTVRPRNALTRCFNALLVKGLKDGMEEAAFAGAVDGACAPEVEAFRTAVIAADAKVGIKRAESLKAADEEIADHRSVAKERFVDHKAANTTPAT